MSAQEVDGARESRGSASPHNHKYTLFRAPKRYKLCVQVPVTIGLLFAIIATILLYTLVLTVSHPHVFTTVSGVKPSVFDVPYQLPSGPGAPRPTEYNVTLTFPNATGNDAEAQRAFTGMMRIALTLPEDTPRIVLHGLGLDVKQVELIPVGGDGERQFLYTQLVAPSYAPAAGALFAQPADHLVLVPSMPNLFGDVETELSSGKYVLELGYSGTMTHGFRGIYVSEDSDLTYPVIGTHFEPVGARLAFPCFDEPALKASWRVSVNLDASDPRKVLSNAPLATTVTSGGQITYTFEATPVMSSYLVAIVVSEFDSVNRTFTSDLNANERSVRVWHPPGQASEATFAADAAAGLMTWFENHFGVEYPLAKIDLAYLPSFEAGAMENWGLVLFRRRLLLVDGATAPTETKRLVASVVAHELAHQWFGDLVTCTWWTNLALHESFATLWAPLAVEALYPELLAGGQWFSTVEAGLEAAASRLQRPVVLPAIASDALANAVFDGITYEFGGSVLRAVYEKIGSDAFFRCVQTFLTAHQLGVATLDEFFAACEETTPVALSDARSMLHTWLHRPGSPTVVVRVDGTTLSVSQTATRGAELPVWAESVVAEYLLEADGSYAHGYLADEEAGLHGVIGALDLASSWYVPVSLTTNAGTAAIGTDGVLAPENTEAQPAEFTASTAITRVLPGAAAYSTYRTVYEPASIRSDQVEAATDSSVVTPAVQERLIADAFALAWETRTPIEHALELASRVANGTDNSTLLHEQVWSTIGSNLMQLDRVARFVLRTDAELRTYINTNIVTPAFSRIGLENTAALRTAYQSLYDPNTTLSETEVDTRLNAVRNIIFELGAVFETASVASSATALFNTWIASPTDMPNGVDGWADVQWAVVSAAVVVLPSESGFEKLFAHLESLDASDATVTALEYTLAFSARREGDVQRVLHRLADTTLTPPEDLPGLLGYLARGSALGQYSAWDFVQDNWSVFEETYVDLPLIKTRLVTSTVHDFSSVGSFDSLAGFLSSRASSLGLVLHGGQALERIARLGAWHDAQSVEFEAWLVAQTA